ncbi:MAG: DUF3592 domain-containing protein [Bacteroidota bacterium]
MIDLLYYTFLLIAVVLLYSAWQQFNKTQNLLLYGTRTQATVIELLASKSSDGTTYRPVFEYQDRNNILQTFESKISSKPAPHKIGDKVPIVYDAEQDLHKTISFWGLYLFPIILFSMGVPLLAIGGGYTLYKYSYIGG